MIWRRIGDGVVGFDHGFSAEVCVAGLAKNIHCRGTLDRDDDEFAELAAALNCPSYPWDFPSPVRQFLRRTTTDHHIVAHA